MADEAPAGLLIPGLGQKVGALNCGRCVQQALDVIRELSEAGIPSVVVGVRALSYYGAGRVPNDWDISVPDHLYDKATSLFTTAPYNDKYEPWPKIYMPERGTLVHLYPRFTLKGFNFFFLVCPDFEYRVNCAPENCEKSKLGVPYPKLELFAQSLLDTQRLHDLANLIDGMNLDKEWGDKHLNFESVGLEDYIKEKNRRMQESPPDSLPEGSSFGIRFSPNLEVQWLKLVANKEKRIGIELPKEKYETRFRIKGWGDPRLRDNRQV